MPVYQFCSVEFIDTSSVFDTVGWMIGSSLFKTVNNEIIRECCSYFKFSLPSELLDKRRDKFQSNFMLCAGIAYCIILASRHNVLMYLS